MQNRSIALVGRPNVGKSRLFNRLLKRRVSIVHDKPGVTRDIVAEKMHGNILVMDTGGIGATPEMTEKIIADATNTQAQFAIDMAGLILFVVDSQEGLTNLDLHIADIIRKSNTDTILVVNKIDEDMHRSRLSEFYKLGFKKIIAVSAEHGLGIDDLLNEIEKIFGEDEKTLDTDTRIKICVAGRPNVGKSSIGNKLLNSKRLIVSEIAGTTRDSVRCELDYTSRNDKLIKFEFYDTAGLRTKRKINTSLDYLSTIRTKKAIQDCEIVMLVIDARDGVSELDKKLSGEILEAGAAIMIVVNKWDYAKESFKSGGINGYDNLRDFKVKFEQAVKEELFFINDSPIHFVSAKDDDDLSGLLENAFSLHKKIMTDLPTGKINSYIKKLLNDNPPKYMSGKRFKIYYALQTNKRPVTIRLFCNREDSLEGSYKRYLEKNIREEFRLGGLPLKLELVGKKLITAEERIGKKKSRIKDK